MEKKQITPKSIYSTRLVKSEDLNHHKTLFAGRTAEWFVEAGFIAAATLHRPESIVCLRIHGMNFTKPVNPGQIVNFESKIVYAGKSSLIAHVNVTINNSDTSFVNGFLTFICVGEDTKPEAHNLVIVPETEEDKKLYEEAKALQIVKKQD